jgi:hypothetical protein
LTVLAGVVYGQSSYEGLYAGTFSGADRGTWQLEVDGGGQISGSMYSMSDKEWADLSGSVSQSGGVALAIPQRGVSGQGQVNAAGRMTGTWIGQEGGDSGTFTGQRKPVRLTVINGTGGGLFVSGKAVTIKAKVPAGMKFVEWDDGNASASRVITMPATPATYEARLADIQRPTVKVTAPKASERVLGTNASYTVRGTAADNGAVAAVRVQVNSEAWADATGTNAWSALVTLSSGLNTVRAFGVDAAGNVSITQSVVCTYVVTAPMTVRVSGQGKVNPNYNGQSLELAKAYRMTAVPGKGFSFANWTDGADAEVSAAPQISFAMASNLVLCANFSDVQRPTVTVNTPAAGQRLVATNALYAARGTAMDNGTLAAVRVRFNDGEWTNASGTYAWSSPMTMLAGTNSLRVFSVDTAGNASPTQSVTFSYAAELPLFEYGGHAYKLVSADRATWALAKRAAEASVLDGNHGHLAVFETAEEGDAVWAALNPALNPAVDNALPRALYEHPDSGARGIWLGASDSAASVPGASEGNFFWNAHGVIAAQNFWRGGLEGAPVPGTCAQWGGGGHGGEPDNWSGAAAKQQNHVALQLDDWPKGMAGQWNDLDGNRPQAYLIEYENHLATLQALSDEGLEALSVFADTDSVPRGDERLLAQAAADFDLAARSAPMNFTNRIYNALAIVLNLVNDPAVRSQAEAYGLNLDDLFDPSCVFAAEPPAVDGSVDILAAALLPAIDKACAELEAVPAAWTGKVMLSPERFPIDEAVWVDSGDVTAMKAALKGLRAFVGLLKAYALNVDFGRLLDQVATPQAVIVADGAIADWAEVPRSLWAVDDPEEMYEYVPAVTQEVAVALNGSEIALLATLSPFAQADFFYATFELRLSNGDAFNDARTHTVELWSEGQDALSGLIDGEPADNLSACLSEAGALEAVFPVPDGLDASQATVESASCEVYGSGLGYHAFWLSQPDDTPLQALRAGQPEFLSKVRDAASLAGVKADLLAALKGYLAADTLIAKRTGFNAEVMHFVDFDASEPGAEEDRLEKRDAVEDVLASLGAAVKVDADPAIEGSETRLLFPGACFKAPYLTTNALPSGLKGTLNDPSWGAFPDPTFGGILPGMTAAKLEKYLSGYTEAKVNTMVWTEQGEPGYELQFRVETERNHMVITNVTVTGPGIEATELWNEGGEWLCRGEIEGKVAVGAKYTFTVAFSDGSQEVLHDTVKAWLAFKPAVTGSTLKWSAVPDAERYEIHAEGPDAILPATQTSFDLSQFGLQLGAAYPIWVYAFNKNGDSASCFVLYTPPGGSGSSTYTAVGSDPWTPVPQ